jgi:TRAP-type C4-dicarboxylate transport system substrate-binding protein
LAIALTSPSPHEGDVRTLTIGEGGAGMKRILLTTVLSFFLAIALGTNNPSQGAEFKPVELKITHFSPVDSPTHSVLVPWCKMLEERTGGRVKGVIYPMEQLGKTRDFIDMTVAGTVDMSTAFVSAYPGRFPLHCYYELPFLLPNAKVGSRIMWEMFEKEESLRAEFREVKVLWFHPMTPAQLYTSKKPVRTLEDLKGLKIRVMGGQTTEIFKALGAIPVVISPTDTYVALERGTVDGAVGGWTSLKLFKFSEVTKHLTVANLWIGEFFMIMNKKRWESFPPDIQKIIGEMSGPWAGDQTTAALEKADIEIIENVKAAGRHEFINLSPEEQTKWRKATMPIWDKWVASVEEKGLPGRRILDETLRLVEKYSK